ncbi:MAG TPA: patatin-like phospholipase family protein [Pyrinomonadaceae bacterium]|nr:patatin-like phospholipase family protein [Pyrinomonadaceae bacterium]
MPQGNVKPTFLLGDLLREINAAREDPARARLWLYEVLLEEYDKLEQPPLLEADIIAIRGKIDALNAECREKDDEDEIQQCAERYNAELTSMIYRAMRAAQASQAKIETDRKRKEYATKYQYLADEDWREKMVDRAVVAEIYGTVQDLRGDFEQEHAEIENKAERKAIVEQKVLERLVKIAEYSDKKQKERRATARREAKDDEDEGDIDGDDGGAKLSHDGIGSARAEKVVGRGLRSALCLSGGGIRSATFNLGILQGLARHGLLENFTYLSTVSGGGFIGSWLTAWMHRRGTREVIRDLKRPPRSPIDPDPKPISHLRTYSNYLSPKVGLMSADTWTLIATLSRNLVMTWLVFIPALMAFLMIPRMWAAFILRPSLAINQDGSLSLWIGSIASIIALSYIGLSLPSTGTRNDRLKYFLLWCLLPLVVASASLSIYWVRLRSDIRGSLGLKDFIFYQLIIIVIPWLVCFVAHLLRAKWRGLPGNTLALNIIKYLVMVLIGTIMVGLAQGVSGFLMWFMATKVFAFNTEATRLYAAFAVPLIMLLFVWAGTLIAGFTSRFTEDADQEWWARAGAWLFIVMFSWTAITLLVLYGPSLLTTTIYKLQHWQESDWTPADIIKLATAVGAVISGIITLAGGFSAKTPANEREAQKAGLMGKVLPLVTSIAAVIFFAFIIVLIAFATNWLLTYATNGLLALGPIRRLNQWVCPLIGYCSPVLANAPLDHRSIILQSTFGLLFLVTLAISLAALLLGWLISSNKFSLHYMWRNRLIRAYLAASDEDRNPNLFTAFDEDDNVHMHELQVEQFHDKSFKESQGSPPVPGSARLLARIRNPPANDSVSIFINSQLSSTTKELLNKFPVPLPVPQSQESESDYKELESAFINDLNDLLRTDTLYDEQRFEDVNLSPETKVILEQIRVDQKRLQHKGDDESAYLLNRRLLEDTYPDEIKRSGMPRPFHVINIALNLTGSDKLSWQDRGAESFTVSPLHAGSFWPSLGYRRAKVYGRRLFNGLQGISLGTAAAISGAFVSPNMGYMMSSPVVRFIMTLFNVRFGWWLGNPGPAGDRRKRTYDLSSPRLSVRPILYEAFGQINDKSPYVYLSDGGHFENLGLYEMVLRRYRFIVVSDASTDADYSFQSLAMSIRQIRVDLGVPIEIRDMSIGNPSQSLKGKYCAVGVIRYPCVDRDPELDKKSKDKDFDGILIYIKPSLIGGEPRDVINYGQGSPDFPQEIIVDQWFSEAQFESYRILGSHMIDRICAGSDRNPVNSDRNQVNFASFARKAREHNQLDFMAFQEQINYAVLEHQFKALLPKEHALPSYQRKVSNFIRDLLR